jgi:transposase
LAHGSPGSSVLSAKGVKVRAIGLDVHRDFCEVAIAEAGKVRSAGRIATRPGVLELFAQSLARDDRVVLEVSGNAWEIARIIEPHVVRVIVVSPTDTGIRQARAKTDRLDARTLAKLLAAGSLERVWMPDERTRVMRRRLSRRSQLVAARTRAKNEIHAILMRRLKGRPEASDLFGKKGRAWLAELELPIEERETLDSGLRQIDFLDEEVALVDRVIAHDALNWPDARRLMTVPGVNLIVAVTFLATIGDIHRFPDRRKLVAQLGLDPKVRQSGDAPASHGHISKQGSAAARHALVEASWSAVRNPGPLHAFYQRIRARRGHQVAITAAARKLACLFWALLWRQQDYAFGQPSLTAKKIPPLGDHRRSAALAGPPRRLGRQPRPARRRTRPRPPGRARLRPDRPRPPSRRSDQGGRERDTARASQRPMKGKAARQTTSP